MQIYQSRLAEIQALGASLIAISPQTPDASFSTAEKNLLKFEVLSDVGNQIARQYRLVFALADEYRALYKRIGVDLPAYNGDDSHELPMPGTFVVAQDGTIQLVEVDADFTERLEPTAIINCLQTLQSHA